METHPYPPDILLGMYKSSPNNLKKQWTKGGIHTFPRKTSRGVISLIISMCVDVWACSMSNVEHQGIWEFESLTFYTL